MTKNPLINALAASFYILLIVTIINILGQIEHRPSGKFIAPLVFLSLLTLSAAVMAYIFGSQPLQLYFDGKKKESVNLFLKTVAVFGAITATLLTAVSLGVLK